MKANELRIGNYIDTGEFHLEIARGIHKYDPSWYKYVHMFRPIPLTEEWLLKLPNNFDGLELRLLNGVCFVDYKGNTLTAINYVHEWQNLYFALTGEELELKEKQDA
jgi:hypothetical protein